MDVDRGPVTLRPLVMLVVSVFVVLAVVAGWAVLRPAAAERERLPEPIRISEPSLPEPSLPEPSPPDPPVPPPAPAPPADVVRPPPLTDDDGDDAGDDAGDDDVEDEDDDD